MPETMSENHDKLLESISIREEQENAAIATLTSETLAKLRVKIEELPQKSRHLLRAAAQLGAAESLDPAALLLRHSRRMCLDMTQQYQLLLLQQNNRRMQTKIDRNYREIQGLRKDLEASRAALRPGAAACGPEQTRALRQKLLSYEESLEKAVAKRLPVPDSLLPRALQELVSELVTLAAEEQRWKEQADEILISRQIRDQLHSLRK